MSQSIPIDDDLEAVRGIAENLRLAMESADFFGCAVNLEHFPNNCCHHASGLLLVLFAEYSILGFCLMKGRAVGWKDEEAHNWVQRGDVVVDITADQFPKLQLPSVIVGQSDWHTSLDVEPQRDALDIDIQYYKHETTIYQRIVETGCLTKI